MIPFFFMIDDAKLGQKVEVQGASVVETPCALYFLLEAAMAIVRD